MAEMEKLLEKEAKKKKKQAAQKALREKQAKMAEARKRKEREVCALCPRKSQYHVRCLGVVAQHLISQAPRPPHAVLPPRDCVFGCRFCCCNGRRR